MKVQLGRYIRSLGALLRYIVSSEALSEHDESRSLAAGAGDEARTIPPESDHSENTGFIRWLIQPEELDFAPSESRPNGKSFIKWFLSSETLDCEQCDESAEGKKKGFLRELFETEELSVTDEEKEK